MSLNPFIRLAQDPVAFFTGLAFALFMFGIVVLAVPWAARQSAVLVHEYRTEKHKGTWWAFGDRTDGYMPPAGWLVRAFAVVFVLATASAALGALAWLVGVGA